MTAFVAAFLPEAMRAVWARHWYWRRFAVGDAKLETQVNCL